MSQQDNKEMAKYFYRASAADFKKIPGSPIAYFLNESAKEVFANSSSLGNVAEPRQGLISGDTGRFLRFWHEVNFNNIGMGMDSRQAANISGLKWFPIDKGGEFRKWYGNNDYVVNWLDDGYEIRNFFDGSGKLRSRPQNMDYYFQPGATWTKVSSGLFSVRITGNGHLFSDAGMKAFASNEKKLWNISSFLNSNVTPFFLGALSETINYEQGNISRLPIVDVDTSTAKQLFNIALADWDSFEFSFDFINNPFFSRDIHQETLNSAYQKLYTYWHETTLEMQRLEEENNRIFIEAYGLQDELTPEVPLSEITLTCNPHYRYGGNLTEQNREDRLQSDTIAELISYAIGCMMGRYSLDRKGLVYAHAGNIGFSELVAEGAYQTFPADGDGILPLTSEHWFDDDVAARVEEFVCTVWGEEHLDENLQFIADSLCLSAIKPLKNTSEEVRKTIRRYLSTQFFKDHLKTYKKRPIYWLFSSGKEKAFECLVYLHRYNEATLPRMRTEYVSPLLGQMANRIELLRLKKVDAATAEAKRLDKEIDSLTKQLTELRAFDDQLKHYADMKITLDLDDGVKVNYGKFGNLLAEVKAITGDKGE